MAEIGKINRLIIKRTRDYGAHLDGGELGDILLPIRDLPVSCQAGDEVEVFVYQNREDRLRATIKKPHATVGQFAVLRVKAVSPSGAYLDWGLEKDLLVPKSEQQHAMREGKEYVVYIFLDQKTNRIAASTKLEKFLNREAPVYKDAEEVDLIVYETTDLGYKSIINNSHSGILYKNEVFQKLFAGQRLKGYIKKIREDGKIDLHLQQSSHQRVDDISRTILQAIKEGGGRLAITDKSPAEDIYTTFGVSKKTFKKAVGALYKKRLITIEPKEIKLAKRQKTNEKVHAGADESLPAASRDRNLPRKD